MDTNSPNPSRILEKDPVCGMSVDPAAAKGRVGYQGKSYFFCSEHCAQKFQQDPVRYLSATSAPEPMGHGGGGLVQLGGLGAAKPAAPAAGAIDPICGMTVDPAHAAGKWNYQGKAYYFCNPRCQEKFQADPARYLAAASAPPRSQDSKRIYVCPMDPEVRQEGPGACPKCGMALEPESVLPARRTEYTCPMHPEIVRSEPGSCPICGMALEPRTASAVEEENPELRDMSRRFWIGSAFTAPLLVLAMGSMRGPLAGRMPTGWGSWIELLLATPVVLWCGWPFFQRFWISIVNRSTNMFTLIGLGVGVAYGYSVVATLAPGIFPESFRDVHGEAHGR